MASDLYDPKKKDRSVRLRLLARRRLVLGVGLLVLVGLIVLAGRSAQSGKAPKAPASARRQPDASGGRAPARHPQTPAGSRMADLRSANLMLYRGVGKIETLPGFANANRLLLCTHNRLLWYRYDTDELRVLHEGEGVYYGAFTGSGRDALGAPTDLWVVSRPHNWHPKDTKEWLLHLNLETGEELARVEIPSRFTHDAVRRRDKVYVADTGDGKVLQLKFPSMEVEREMPLFTLKEHINTLAPTADDKLWVVQHNLGQSALAQIDLKSGEIVRKIEGVGRMAHGLVFWDRYAVVLDSETPGLNLVDLVSGHVTNEWQLGDSRFFLKGLCVVDDIAFFGIAPHTPRGDRADPSMNCHLAAYDLKSHVLLWARQLPTHGLLNVVAAPHLAVESTTYSLNTAAQINYKTKKEFESMLAKAKETPLAPLAGYKAGGGDLGSRVVRGAGEVWSASKARRRQAREEYSGGGGGVALGTGARAPGRHGSGAGGDGGGGGHKLSLSETEQLPPTDPVAKHPAKIGGYWSSGYPRMELAAKSGQGLAAGLQLLLLRTDVSKLKEHLLSVPEADWTDEEQARSNAYLTGRNANLGAVKPGARAIVLMFSDHNGNQVARFPWYHRFAPLVEPIVKQIIGEQDMANIIRMQLAWMSPHTQIKPHQDQGGYASAAHRIHIVVATNPQVVFAQCPGKGARRIRDAVHATAHMQDGGSGGGADDASGCMPIHVTEEGLVFELNNRLRHYVVNGGDTPRIHLLVDVAETPRQPFDLAVGQQCDYSSGRIEC